MSLVMRKQAFGFSDQTTLKSPSQAAKQAIGLKAKQDFSDIFYLGNETKLAYQCRLICNDVVCIDTKPV